MLWSENIDLQEIDENNGLFTWVKQRINDKSKQNL